NECTLTVAVVSELPETYSEDRTGILNRASDGSEQFQLHTPVPPLDLRLFAEIEPQKVRLGVKPLQIPANGDRLGEIGTVIEFQDRHPTGRVLCEEFGRAALAGQNIDLFKRKLDALFCREDANAARIGRYCMIVELHRTGHFNPSQTQSDAFILLPMTDECQPNMPHRSLIKANQLLAEGPIAASLGRIGPIPAHVERRRRRHSSGGHDGAQCDTVKDGPVVGLRDPRPDRPHDRGGFHGHSAAPAHCDVGPTGCDASMSNCDVPGSDRDASMSGYDVTSSGDASMPNRDVTGSDGDTSMSNCAVADHRDIST